MNPKTSRLLMSAAALLPALPAFALNIVLTNDDGWDSIGIQAMKDALVLSGHEVYLAASLTQQSGSSAAINIQSLEVIKQKSTDGALEFSVALPDGVTGAEPATCAAVGIGIATADLGSPPDLVISGINSGQNLGAATQVSGTVGAATAAMSSGLGGYQLPAIAISTDPVCSGSSEQCDEANSQQYTRVAGWVAGFVDELEQRAKNGPLMPAGYGVNVNYPPLVSPVGAKLSRQGQAFLLGGNPGSIVFNCTGDCIGMPDGAASTVVPGFDSISVEEVKNADTTNNLEGYITVVPLFPDFTADKPAENGTAKKFRKSLKKTLKAMGY